jgi:hypothetical protein
MRLSKNRRIESSFDVNILDWRHGAAVPGVSQAREQELTF